MSKNLRINEQEYNGVSLVTIPTTDGGTATFKDVEEVVIPAGQLSVTENGQYDVERYASVDVNVEAVSGGGGLSIDDVVMGTAPSGDVVLNTATKIRNYTFMDNATITTLRAPEVLEIGNSAFQMTKADTILELVDIPKCTIIGNYALSYRQSLTDLTLPSVDNIGNSAFNMCSGLKTVKFGSKLTKVGTNPFQNCTGLKDIYVPWAEGEVTWTVPDTATVHYNTQYDENWNVVS